MEDQIRNATLRLFDLERQIAHWLASARLFRDAEEFASLESWRSVEVEIGLPLRKSVNVVVEDLVAHGERALQHLSLARAGQISVEKVEAEVQRFRHLYVKVDTTLAFLGEAVNSRTSPQLRTALTMLDKLAVSSMEKVLQQAGKPVPGVLVYQDKGLGASILRAGVRLWAPGMVMPVAAIKIVRHNLYRPTSLFHETGHQVAYLTGWVPAMKDSLGTCLGGDDELRKMWQPWVSEIAADVFAFLHTGYASVAALYDVVGDANTILNWPIGDPHPIGWLRAMLGCTFSRLCYGRDGPWDNLQGAMQARFPIESTQETLRQLLTRSVAVMPEIARACLQTPVPALGGKPMTSVLDPQRVSPKALAELERMAGPALWTSSHWRSLEGIRIVALARLREAEHPEHASKWINLARNWLTNTNTALAA